jgi:hypothetical protein
VGMRYSGKSIRRIIDQEKTENMQDWMTLAFPIPNPGLDVSHLTRTGTRKVSHCYTKH